MSALPTYRQPGRRYDGLGRLVPRNPLAGRQGLVWLLQLGLAEQFRRKVPDTHTLGPWVLCRCGELVAVDAETVVCCPQTCGQWYLRAGSIRWANWGEAPCEVRS